MSILKSSELRKGPEPKADLDAAFYRRVELVESSFDLYHSYLQDYLFSLTRQWQDAENLAQDLWRHALLHLPESHIPQLGILRRKAYQLFVDRYRMLVRRKETLTDEVPETGGISGAPEPFTESEEADLERRFWSELGDIGLDEAQRNVVWQHCRFQYTFQELSELTGTPKSTISDWVKLGRMKIRERLEA